MLLVESLARLLHDLDLSIIVLEPHNKHHWSYTNPDAIHLFSGKRLFECGLRSLVFIVVDLTIIESTITGVYRGGLFPWQLLLLSSSSSGTDYCISTIHRNCRYQP